MHLVGSPVVVAPDGRRLTHAVVQLDRLSVADAPELFTALGDIELANQRLHLGWTAYAPNVWAGPVDLATKLALLTHAFDDCHMHRVKIQTDAINLRSQAAIARLGAVREGVLREHVLRADGTWRDTVVFSILAAEWPTVRARLAGRLADA